MFSIDFPAPLRAITVQITAYKPAYGADLGVLYHKRGKDARQKTQDSRQKGINSELRKSIRLRLGQAYSNCFLD